MSKSTPSKEKISNSKHQCFTLMCKNIALNYNYIIKKNIFIYLYQRFHTARGAVQLA